MMQYKTFVRRTFIALISMAAVGLIGCSTTAEPEMTALSPAPPLPAEFTAEPAPFATLGAGDSLGVLVFATPIEFPVTGETAITGIPGEQFTE